MRAIYLISILFDFDVARKSPLFLDVIIVASLAWHLNALFKHIKDIALSLSRARSVPYTHRSIRPDWNYLVSPHNTPHTHTLCEGLDWAMIMLGSKLLCSALTVSVTAAGVQIASTKATTIWRGIRGTDSPMQLTRLPIPQCAIKCCLDFPLALLCLFYLLSVSVSSFLSLSHCFSLIPSHSALGHAKVITLCRRPHHCL